MGRKLLTATGQLLGMRREQLAIPLDAATGLDRADVGGEMYMPQTSRRHPSTTIPEIGVTWKDAMPA